MKFLKAQTIVLISFLMLGFFMGEEKQVEGFHLMLLFHALLIKIGLAAPLILAVIAKIIILLGLKKKAILLPLLLSGTQPQDSGEHTYGAPSSTSYGRIKRSVDFVQQIVGQVDIGEDQLLENILKIDILRCGERLLCEVAAAQASQKVDVDEEAMISIFSSESGKKPGKAQKVYRNAIMTGYRHRNCAQSYATCPFDRKQMMDLAHLVVGSELLPSIEDSIKVKTSTIRPNSTTAAPKATQQKFNEQEFIQKFTKPRRS